MKYYSRTPEELREHLENRKLATRSDSKKGVIL